MATHEADESVEMQPKISGRFSMSSIYSTFVYIKFNLENERNGFGEDISHSSSDHSTFRICCIGMCFF